MRKIYFDEHVEYLRLISNGRRNSEITRLFNKKFGLSASIKAVATLRKKHGIKNNMPTGIDPEYTPTHINYLRKLSEQGLFNNEITQKFNKRFGLNKTGAAIQLLRCKFGIKTSARNYWEKGHIPYNKGKKGISYPGMEKTQFKKGSFPHNWVPIGTERITADGYLEVKVQEHCGIRNWKGKHVIIWEEAHGKLPKGHVVIFCDGNKQNHALENLLLVSRKQLVRMNQMGLISDDTEFTKAGVIIADIHNKVGERKRKERENARRKKYI